MLKKIGLILSIAFFNTSIGSAQTNEKEYTLDWQVKSIKDPITGKSVNYMYIPEISGLHSKNDFPFISYSFEAGINAVYDITITQTVFESFNQELVPSNYKDKKADLSKLMTPFINQLCSREVNYTNIQLTPFQLNTSSKSFERLKSFKLILTKKQKLNTSLRSKTWKNSSILSSGSLVNIRIKNPGLYKIDKALLTKMGINASSIDPRNIKIYGMGGGMLPQNTNDIKYDDGEEMAIQVIGEQDGKFDDQDYILFYHKGPHVWEFDTASKSYNHIYNIYAEESGIYLTVGNSQGKRMGSIDRSTGNVNKTVNTFDDPYFYEKELTNLSHTGRTWYGEEFDKQTSFSFNFNFNDLSTEKSIIKTSFAGRTFNKSAIPFFDISINGNWVNSVPLVTTDPDYGSPYMIPISSKDEFTGSNSVNVKFDLQKSADYTAKGWLDYFEIINRRNLLFNGSTMSFRDTKTFNQTDLMYEIINGASKNILDISDVINPKIVVGQNNGNNLNIYDNNKDYLHEYIVFENGFLTPETWYAVTNQNIHNSNAVDMVILTHPDFMSEANRYADYKRAKGLRVKTITPQTIYNEFSCGVQDITAIRNYMKMLYDKATSVNDKPKYLLILADGSYDFKDRVKNNTNLVPTYESFDSYTTYSFCNDEYYGTLDDGEGYLIDSQEEGLDVAVGRIPVETALEAKQMVNKLIHYNSYESFGDWRQYVTVIGDDEDGNIHLQQAETVSNYIQTAEPGLNLNKLYLDAYEKKVIDGIPSYPDVKDELKRILDKGCLIVNYSGHGGPYQWAHEKIFDVTDIDALKNYNYLPIFMAATCDFGPFDNPELRSAGEKLMLSNVGGGIAYLGTSRIANTGQNNPFNKGLFEKNMFEIKNGKYQTIGEAYMKIKNGGINLLRNFYLMGDPSLDLGLSVNKVVTTHIQNKPVNIKGDTIKALQYVTISGEIQDINNNIISDFNGTVFPTVFDKAVKYRTLGNVSSSIPLEFY
ncbi:MAG: type IX secretion system sortase PorU, partial [Bacteroidetes bacterium]|nr:type IX secretion system sortase PorU [Bacteroidota bacterium]